MVFVGTLLLCGVLNVSAQGRHQRQGGPNEPSEEQRQEMVERQVASLVERMSLDDITAAWFVPLFKEYGEALMTVRKAAIPEKDKSIDGLSDDDAEAMILNVFTSEEKTVAVKREYYARFKERLTPQQLLKVFAVHLGQQGNRRSQRGQRDGQDGQRFHGGPEGFVPPPDGFGPPPGGGFGGPF